ncbi:MAG: hypothetical protein M3Q84_07765 [Actinomycetota bacterium]|nr:hypothetical protein [Actinomycetota bacterium]
MTIDCPPGSVAGTTVRWDLDNGGFDEAMRDELRQRAQDLARVLGGDPPPSGWPAS